MISFPASHNLPTPGSAWGAKDVRLGSSTVLQVRSSDSSQSSTWKSVRDGNSLSPSHNHWVLSVLTNPLCDSAEVFTWESLTTCDYNGRSTKDDRKTSSKIPKTFTGKMCKRVVLFAMKFNEEIRRKYTAMLCMVTFWWKTDLMYNVDSMR